MASEIVVAIIGLIGMIASPLLSVFVSSQLTNYRIEQLESEVRKHNELISRTYQLEQDTALQAEQIKEHGRRIERLEDKADE